MTAAARRPAPGGWAERCRRCGRTWEPADRRWLCTCGGLLDLEGPPLDPLPAGEGPRSVWRYRHVLPVAGDGTAWERTTMGEGDTPLLEIRPGLWLKLDHVMPTGSFKDRGAAVTVALAAGLGVRRVVADSSGNAGLAVAAYSARAGLHAEVYVPEGTAPFKVEAMEAHGAAVVRVPGSREAAAAAARERAGSPAGGAWYASHVYQPAFVHGVKTLAFELWEQLGRRAPGTVIVPAGNGTLVLGLGTGFGELQAAGRVPAPPAIVAVQAERCAPLAGREPGGPTVAAGIAIAEPPRAEQVRAAVAASGGQVVTVGEDAIVAARAGLGRLGVRVEPTAAVGWAAWAGGAGAWRPPVVVVLTGRNAA